MLSVLPDTSVIMTASQIAAKLIKIGLGNCFCYIRETATQGAIQICDAVARKWTETCLCDRYYVTKRQRMRKLAGQRHVTLSYFVSLVTDPSCLWTLPLSSQIIDSTVWELTTTPSSWKKKTTMAFVALAQPLLVPTPSCLLGDSQ